MAFMFSPQELEAFHTIYARLVTVLGFHPSQSQKVIAFWNWLEFQGCYRFLYRIQIWPVPNLNVLAKEALTCLFFMEKEGFPPPVIEVDVAIPLTRAIFRNNLSFRRLYEDRLIGISRIEGFIKYVCERAFADLVPPNLSNARQYFQPSELVPRAASLPPAMPCGDLPGDRTFLLTGSLDHPLSLEELQDFIARTFENCLETMYMDEPPKMLPVYACLVVRSPPDVARILGAKKIDKFSVNGKDVWLKLLAGLPHYGPVDPSTGSSSSR